MKALCVHAGPRSLATLRRHGLRPEHVRVVPAAAEGSKRLVLNARDRYIFNEWLRRALADTRWQALLQMRAGVTRIL